MTKSSIGMLEDQLVCLLFRQALLDRQASRPDCSPRNSHDIHRVKGMSPGLSHYLRLDAEVVARTESRVSFGDGRIQRLPTGYL